MINENCWEDIEAFASSDEFSRFRDWLLEKLDSGIVVESSAKETDPMIPAGFDYEVVRRTDNGERWILVAPELPFTGSWNRLP